jgi:hypothetical protein
MHLVTAGRVLSGHLGGQILPEQYDGRRGPPAQAGRDVVRDVGRHPGCCSQPQQVVEEQLVAGDEQSGSRRHGADSDGPQPHLPGPAYTLGTTRPRPWLWTASGPEQPFRTGAEQTGRGR